MSTVSLNLSPTKASSAFAEQPVQGERVRRQTRLPRLSSSISREIEYAARDVRATSELNETLSPHLPIAEATVTKPLAEKNYRLLSFFERVTMGLGHYKHTFGWPVTDQTVPLQVAYPWTPYSRDFKIGDEPEKVSFDSHQVCTRCGLQRFFDSRTFTPGAYFVRLDRSV